MGFSEIRIEFSQAHYIPSTPLCFLDELIPCNPLLYSCSQASQETGWRLKCTLNGGPIMGTPGVTQFVYFCSVVVYIIVMAICS